jgi:hypothetical protein
MIPLAECCRTWFSRAFRPAWSYRVRDTWDDGRDWNHLSKFESKHTLIDAARVEVIARHKLRDNSWYVRSDTIPLQDKRFRKYCAEIKMLMPAALVPSLTVK